MVYSSNVLRHIGSREGRTTGAPWCPMTALCGRVCVAIFSTRLTDRFAQVLAFRVTPIWTVWSAFFSDWLSIRIAIHEVDREVIFGRSS